MLQFFHRICTMYAISTCNIFMKSNAENVYILSGNKSEEETKSGRKIRALEPTQLLNALKNTHTCTLQDTSTYTIFIVTEGSRW